MRERERESEEGKRTAPPLPPPHSFQALERHGRWEELRRLGSVTLTAGWAESVARGPEGYLSDLYETA